MNCEKCGKELTKHNEQVYCTSCDFWADKLKHIEIHPICRGNCYALADPLINRTNPQWNAFGGRWFKIEMNDGRIFYTNNLFHNGTVPDIWQPDLADNATVTEIFGDEIKKLSHLNYIKRAGLIKSGMQHLLAEGTTSYFS